MPDVTVSFTNAQWTRVIAASDYIKGREDATDVDEAYLSNQWKEQVQSWVEASEKSTASVSAWE